MFSEVQNERLTAVGPGTPMGELMRRYWQPIAASVELEDSLFRTKEVRLLCEDLVLWRDLEGNLGLTDRFCSHRRMNLALGMVEEDGIRCPYHGWKFDRIGSCVEQPFEETVRPGSQFKQKCGIAGYQVQELAGLVWAYLGPLPAPLLPRWAPLAWDNVVRDITIAELACNWLQCQENSLDPVHTEWLHTNYADYVRGLKNSTEGTRFQALGPTAGRPHKKIRFYDFEHGIAKARLVEGDTGEEEDWTVGHPILFPHMLVTGCQFSYTMQFRVPMDDTTTNHITLYVFPAAPGTSAPPQAVVPYRHVPLRDDGGEWILEYSFNQDYMAWVEQGPVARRELEKLGESDRGITRFRHMLLEQVRRVEQGEVPMNVFRDPEENVCVDFPRERIKHGMTTRPIYVPRPGEHAGIAGEAGFSADSDLIEATLATWDTIPEFARLPGAATAAAATAEVIDVEQLLAAPDQEATALVAEDESPVRAVSYGELSRMTANLRRQLRDLGLRSEHVVPILSGRTPESVALALALVAEGAAFCFINEKFSSADRLWLVEHMSPIGLVVDARGAALLTEDGAEEVRSEDLAVLRPIHLAAPAVGYRPPAGRPVLDAADDTNSAARLARRRGAACSLGAVEVHFSSGSTGRPKGALGSAAGLHHFTGVQIDCYKLTGDDRLLSCIGFSNNLGLVQIFSALSVGASLHLTHETAPEALGRIIRRSGITGLGGSTGFWAKVVTDAAGDGPLLGDTPTLRYVSTGGTRTTGSAFRELSRRLGPDVAIHDIYGQAEIRQATHILIDSPEHRTHDGSVGRAVPGSILFIARDRDETAAVGEVGEVGYVGPGIMLGYLGMTELSESRTVPHGRFPDQRVIYTGDLGYLDEDGYLFLVGRADRRIDLTDHSFWPSDVEEVLAAHPGVIEPIVFGLPDPVAGARVVAVILAKEGTSGHEVLDLARGQLPAHMVPDDIAVWARFPRTANGKPALVRIKDEYLAAEGAGASR